MFIQAHRKCLLCLYRNSVELTEKRFSVNTKTDENEDTTEWGNGENEQFFFLFVWESCPSPGFWCVSVASVKISTLCEFLVETMKPSYNFSMVIIVINILCGCTDAVIRRTILWKKKQVRWSLRRGIWIEWHKHICFWIDRSSSLGKNSNHVDL